MPKVLILTVPHGAAHQRIAHALRKALLELEPSLKVDVVDMLAHCARWFRAYYNSYKIPLRYWPGLWGWIESRQHEGRATGPLGLYRRGAQGLFRFIESLQPDVVVATETGICEIAALMKRECNARFLLVGVDGLDADRAWVQPEVDLYLASPDPVVAQLRAAGVPPEKIVECGMPLDPAFRALPGRATARARLDVADETPLLLVLFGGAGFGKPRKIVPALDKVQHRFQAVFIAGRNERLRAEAERLCGGRADRRVFGWVDNMHEWLAAADLVLNKPSGLAMVEAMTCGLPFLALDPLPGNERRHCDLIERWGVGRWVRRHDELAATLDSVLGRPQELAQMRQRALERARPNAAPAAASAVLRLAAARRPRGARLHQPHAMSADR